ncbi:MAG: hypothetical protein MK188_01635 [Gammaproteobacteria bacterium]|nr:hypothetical protein [Gammaproteobacteria bacterium]
MKQTVFLLLLTALCCSPNLAIQASDKSKIHASTLDHSNSAKQAVLSEDLDRAAKLIESTIKSHPEYAESYRVAGDIYIVQARSASLFSAPGLAKKALKNYKKAVQMEPNNPRYRLNLMQYYLNAPSIVGGDKEKAEEEAKQIEKLQPLMGVVAHSILYRNKNDLDSLKSLFSSLSSDQLMQPLVRLERAQFLIINKQEQAGMNELNQLAGINPDSLLGEEDKRVPYKALLVMGFAGLENEKLYQAAIGGFKRYIDTAPQSYGYPDRRWIRLSLAQLLAQGGDEKAAKSALKKIQQESKSKELLKETKKALKRLS